MIKMAELFGEVLRPVYRGGRVPTSDELAELGKVPDPKLGNVNVFCSGCGTLDVISRNAGEEFCRRAGVAAPADWKGYYIQIDRCDSCTPGQFFVNPSLKQV